MNRLFFLSLIIYCINLDAQNIDTNSVIYKAQMVNDSTSNRLDKNEQNFTDSIALLNKKNKELIESRKSYNLGLLLLGQEKYIDAINAFSDAIIIDSLFISAYMSRAKSYMAIDDTLAISDFKRVFLLDSTNLNPLYSIAAIQLKIDRLLAKKTYELIISRDIKEHKAYSSLGVLAFLEKDYQKAEEMFTISLAIENNAYCFNDRGSCYRKMERLDAAEKDYLAAISLDDNLVFIYNNLASIYLKQEKMDQALTYYDLAISKDSEYVLAYNNRASLFLERKEYEKARLDVEQALLLNPEYSPAYNNNGIIHYYYKEYSEAIVNFDKAIDLDNNYAKAYLNRGICKQMMRDDEGACLDWERAKELGVVIAKKYFNNDCE